MSDIKLNWDVIIQLLAAGNPFIWALVIIAFFCLGVLAWIKYEESLRRLASLILEQCSSKYRAQKASQIEDRELCNQRFEKFADKIYGLICRVSDLTIDQDEGRNKFYQFLVKTSLETFFKQFTTLFTDYSQGKITPADFMSYRKTHHQSTAIAICDAQNIIREQLVSESWPKEKIDYINETFKVWVSKHVGFLRELLSSDEMTIEVVKTWLVFFYEIFTDVEKFGLMINGRITGMKFDNLDIKGPHHE